MTTRAACANSAWLTSTTWATVDSTSFLNSESANTVLTTSYVESTSSTPGAITVDGIGVKIASRAASPTGTMSVHLAIAGVEVTGSAVTVNVSDLPTCVATTGTTTPVDTAEGGWFFLKFATPLLLIAATAYTVGAKTSSSTQVNLWSSATTNWSRYLRTTTTGAMAAGDDAIITKEWTAAATGTARTVTMDETATTDYGSNTTSQVTPSLAITQGGTLTYSTNIAANLRQSGYVIVYNGGTLSIGASGAEVARGSTAVLQFDCAADGDFGLVARKGATVNMYGLSRTSGKNVVFTKLNADAAASATSITVVDDTGWLSGDVLCFAPTSRTFSQYEKKTTTGAATATTIAVSALTNAHSGTSPTQGEVGLLTRNVVVTAVTAGLVTFFVCGTTAIVNCSWTEFQYLGSNVYPKVGLNILTTTGTANFQYCSLHDCDGTAIMANSGATWSNFTFQNFVIYNYGINFGSYGMYLAATSGTWTITDGLMIGNATAFDTTGGIYMWDVGGTLDRVTIAGISGTSNMGCFVWHENDATIAHGTLHAHSSACCGGLFLSRCYGTIDSLDAWRTASAAYIWDSNGQGRAGQTMNINGGLAFGNTAGGIAISNGGVYNLNFSNMTFAADTTFASEYGIHYPNGGVTVGTINFRNCSFSPATGIYAKLSYELYIDISKSIPITFFDNCIINSTLFFRAAEMDQMQLSGPIVLVQNYNQVANDNRVYSQAFVGNTFNVVRSNSVTVHGSDLLSEQLVPATVLTKLQTAPKYVACNSGATATINIWVRKDGTYNGAAPRLILLNQRSMGVTADTVCDTLSVGTNTWEQLTYTTSAAPQDGVFAFVVDCDGTAGNIYVSDVST